jgi:hypothetical protein
MLPAGARQDIAFSGPHPPTPCSRRVKQRHRTKIVEPAHRGPSTATKNLNRPSHGGSSVVSPLEEASDSSDEALAKADVPKSRQFCCDEERRTVEAVGSKERPWLMLNYLKQKGFLFPGLPVYRAEPWRGRPDFRIDLRPDLKIRESIPPSR